MADWEDGTYDDGDVAYGADALLLALGQDKAIPREDALTAAEAVLRSIGLTRERPRSVGVNIPCGYCGQSDGHKAGCPAVVLDRKPVDTGALQRSLKVDRA